MILELLWVPTVDGDTGKTDPWSQHVVTSLSLSAPSNSFTVKCLDLETHSYPPAVSGCMDREFWGPGNPEHGSGEKALNGHIPNLALGGKNSGSCLWDVELLSGVTLAQGCPWSWLQFPDKLGCSLRLSQSTHPSPTLRRWGIIIWVLCTSWAASPLSFTGVLPKSPPHLISSWYLLLEGPEP